jgi:hypothetical protein
VRFDGEGLPESASGDGAGYNVYHVPDQDTTEPAPAPPPTPPVASFSPPPEHPPAGAHRLSGLLIAVALVALIALILSALL